MQPTHCLDCAMPLRKKTQRAADHPGTRAYGAHGRCSACYKAHKGGRKAIDEKAKEAISESQHRNNVAALEGFLASRRARLARRAA